MSALQSRSDQNKWIVLFGLWVLHGAIAFWQFTVLPANQRNFLFEFSPSRLFLSAALLLWVIFDVALMVLVSKKSLWWIELEVALSKPRIKDITLILATLMVFLRISLGFLRGLFGQQLINQYGGYIDILLPVMNLMTYMSVELIILIIYY